MQKIRLNPRFLAKKNMNLLPLFNPCNRLYVNVQGVHASVNSVIVLIYCMTGVARHRPLIDEEAARAPTPLKNTFGIIKNAFCIIIRE